MALSRSPDPGSDAVRTVPESSIIGVTGTTGRVGSQVASRLSERGIPIRQIVRDAARAPSFPGSTVAVADYADDAAVRAALEGLDTVFMVSAAEHPDRVGQHATFVDAASRAGVRHVVYTSFYGAAPDATFTFARDHAATERLIVDSGMAFTFLRDNFYLDLIVHFVGEDGVIRGPAANGRVAAVAIADVVDVAAQVLTDPPTHAARTYDLCGPDAFDLDALAHEIAEATGRPTRYRPETLEEAYASRAVYGAPGWEVDGWVTTYQAIAAGEMAGLSRDVETITGHPPRSLRDVLRGVER